jgi:hypothetical protein
VLSAVDFGGATFSGGGDFRGITFKGDADFRQATFSGDADFVRTTFSGDARFDAASFVGDAFFGRVTFGGNADFGAASFGAAAFLVGTTFSGIAVFVEGTFSGHAFFMGASFNGAARFDTATFRGNGDFFWATFGAAAFFVEATFSRVAVFVEGTFSHDARFVGTTFIGNANSNTPVGEVASAEAALLCAAVSGVENLGSPVDLAPAARAVWAAGRRLAGLEEPWHRFWVQFASAVEAERLDLPWDVVCGWRVEPQFHGEVMRLLDGKLQAEATLRQRFASVSAAPPDGRYEREQITERLLELARDAAASAVEDSRHPALLARQQTGLIRNELTQVREDLADVVHPLTAIERRLERIEERQTQAEADNTRTVQALERLLALLQAADLAHLQPSRVGGDSDGMAERQPYYSPAPRPYVRLAEDAAAKLSSFPDVAELLLFDMRGIAVRVGGADVYADMAVTDTAGDRWLAEVKTRPGSRAKRSARRLLAQTLLDEAGSDWRWVIISASAARSATNWADIVSAAA